MLFYVVMKILKHMKIEFNIELDIELWNSNDQPFVIQAHQQ